MPNLPPGPYIYRDGYVRDANGKAVADVKRLRKLQAEEVAVAELLIRAEQRERTGGWIAAVERLPNHGAIVLAYNENRHFRIVMLSVEGSFLQVPGGWPMKPQPTHWQPLLPEPPTC